MQFNRENKQKSDDYRNINKYETKYETKYKYEYKNNEYKIFVGNVPYQCTQEEFEKCFEHIEGYVRAELITIYKDTENSEEMANLLSSSHTSRGFGFITIKSYYNAEKLKMRNDIIFKGRVLRFTQYHDDDNMKKNILTNYLEHNNNYVYVDGIPDGKNREWLKTYFNAYEPIGRCYISVDNETGKMKNDGMIEIIDDIKYKNILVKRWHNNDNIQLYTTKYKGKITQILNIINDCELNKKHIQNTGQIDVFNYYH